MKKSVAALSAAVLAVCVGDFALTHSRLIADSDYFVKNDFEITQCNHPEKVWNRVFFGNSVVISAFMEDSSNSGYINLGLDYGVVTDLRDMIKKNEINIGSELVIGLNYLTLYDEFDTNPTYIWHKKPYQPYAYFERDRFYPLITNGFDKLINGENPMPYKYLPQSKSVYHGRVDESAMRDKLKEYETEYFNQPLEKFSKNIAALTEVIEYCQKHDILVRIVWMPWNGRYEKPQLLKDVKNAANDAVKKYQIDILDLEDECPEEWFYDTGHLNYDIGSPQFTKILDNWL